MSGTIGDIAFSRSISFVKRMTCPRLIDQIITARCVGPECLCIITVCKGIQHLTSDILDAGIRECCNSITAGRDMPFPFLHADHEYQTVTIRTVTEITVIVKVICASFNAAVTIEIIYSRDRHIHFLALTEFIQKLGDLILFRIGKKVCCI